METGIFYSQHEWIRPQPTELVKAAPDGPDWLHEIKFDG
jgi:ATP-dependent DNA ligase